MTYYIVEFHADGGQACIPGRRVFTDKNAAERFKSVMEKEPGHHCRDSVRLTISDIDPGNEGAIERICPDTRYWTREDYLRAERQP